MLAKDLLFAIRNLWKNKLVSFINGLGLSIGITACLVIFLLVNYETSFDTFSPDRDRIYRVYSSFSGTFTGMNHGVPTGFADKVRESFTGVDAVANFHTWNQNVTIKGDQGERTINGEETKTIVAHPDYFNVFNYYEWLIGSAEQSLHAPRQVVLTETTARNYFPNMPLDKVIGREIVYADSLSVSVSGIVRDVHHKTDLDFTAFISFNTIEGTWLKDEIHLNGWSGTNSNSLLFVKMLPGVRRGQLEQQMKILADRYAEGNKGDATKYTPKVQSLAELHFNPDLGIFDDSRAVMKRSTMLTLGVIAILLLVLASINFINLETAQASRRSKEVGVRKVLGSSRMRLIRHFLLESFTLTLLAILFSIGLSALVIRTFSELFPPDLSLDFSDYRVGLFLLTSLIGVSGLAGLYPAFVLSAARPVQALRNIVTFRSAGTRSSFVRKSLTIFQFSVAQVLIIASIAVGMQINFMLNKDLGFSTDKIISVNTPYWERPAKRLALKHELDQIADIETSAMQNSSPSSQGRWSNSLGYYNGKEVLTHSVYIKTGDSAYLPLYKLKLLAGRNIRTTDSVTEYIINEVYMKMLGFKDPHDAIGKLINDKPIVGVVKDFHSRSLHTAIDPMVIMCSPENMASIGVRLKGTGLNNIQPTLEKMEAAWKKVYGDENFQYKFVDDIVRSYYETEQRTGRLAKAATGIAILISCLGLFALSSFTVIQRTKEIGIRKALGATVNSIVILLSRDFVLLVVIAFIVSAPIAYYVADRWLQDFAYRIDVGVWIFVVAGVSSVATALITISFRTVGAASADPVKALRYE